MYIGLILFFYYYFEKVITDVGDAPYDLVEPVLRKMSAKQLVDIEKNSPQIKVRSDDLWRRLIMKDFPDRPVPQSRFRKTYSKYFKEKEAHLQNASIRLREGMKKFEEEKAARTITSLEVDPRAAKARAKFKSSSAAPSGSRLIQKAMQSARTKGPMFSNKNIQFTNVRPPRNIKTLSDTRDNNRLRLNSSPDRANQQERQQQTASPISVPSSVTGKRQRSEGGQQNTDDNNTKKPVKKPQARSSVFLPKR